MKNIRTALLLTAAAMAPFAHAADPVETIPRSYLSPSFESKSPQPLPASWKWSLAPMVASQGLDIASSYGMRELNPLLAGPQDQFGVKAAMVKVGVTAALVGVEVLIVKAHPGAAKIFTKINWSGAALTAGFAAHNFAIR
jgi:hypothetical protein